MLEPILENGVFTTLLFNKKLHNFDEHWNRLISHAAYFDYHIPDKNIIKKKILTDISSSTIPKRIKIIIFKSAYKIQIQDYLLADLSIYKGIKVIISSIKAHDFLGTFKTTNYLIYSLAYEEAYKLGFFEGLLCNHQGYLVDGSKTGILVYQNNRFIALSGGLKSIMREQVINYIKNKNIPIDYKYLKPKDIHGEILLTNSLMGALPVNSIKSLIIKEIVTHHRTF